MPDTPSHKDDTNLKHSERPGPFSGRRILVTGASRGIAAAIALALGRAGAQVLLHHCAEVDAASGFEDAAARLKAAIDQGTGSAHILDADLTVPGAGSDLATKALAAHGPIDSVVLSASIQIHKPILLQTMPEVERQVRINLFANIEILQHLIPGMAEHGFGRILAIGSVQEVAPSAEMPVYSLTKAALKNLVENLAVQTGASGITVNNLAPGLIETDRNAFRRKDAEAWERMARSANPVGRAGLPHDMVAPALFFLSSDSSFVTGASLYATGGAHIRNNSADGRPPKLMLPEMAGDLTRKPGQ
ncbi:MAG TPA: SDR family oxidoreductase [Devosiaceae bacterium]